MVFLLPALAIVVLVCLQYGVSHDQLSHADAIEAFWVSVGFLALLGLGSIATTLSEAKEKFEELVEHLMKDE